MTPREPFDLDAVKRNWERAVAPDSSSSARFTRVRAPQNPFPIAREILTRARARALADFAPHAAVLETFFTQAKDLVDRLEAHTKAGADSKAPPKVPDAEGDALRAELESAFVDLEDLFEVFAGIGR